MALAVFDFITATASRLKVLAGEGRATFLWRRLRRWTNEGAFWFTISVILFAVAVAATMQGIAEVVERERRLRNEGIVLLGTQQVPKRDETRLGIIATVLADANNPTCPKQDHADRSQVLQRALRRLDLRPARPVLTDWPDCKGDRGCAAIRDVMLYRRQNTRFAFIRGLQPTHKSRPHFRDDFRVISITFVATSPSKVMWDADRRSEIPMDAGG